MVALRFDATKYEPQRAFDLLPDGDYPVVIVRSDFKPNSKGTGRFIELEMAIQGGQYNNQRVFERLNVENPSQQTVDIANRTLTSICCVTGVLHLEDLQQLHNRPFVAIVRQVPRGDQKHLPEEERGKSNAVKGYRNADGSNPGFQGQVSNPQSAPQWAQQQPQSNGNGSAPPGVGGQNWAQPQQQAAPPAPAPMPSGNAPPPWARG